MKTLMISAICYTMATSTSIAQTAYFEKGNKKSYRQAIMELNAQASTLNYGWDGTNQSNQRTYIRPNVDGYGQLHYRLPRPIIDPCPNDAECPEPYAR